MKHSISWNCMFTPPSKMFFSRLFFYFSSFDRGFVWKREKLNSRHEFSNEYFMLVETRSLNKFFLTFLLLFAILYK